MNELIKISEEQLTTIQVVKSIYTVSITQLGQTKNIDVTGISVIPQFIEVKPNDIRNSIINKAQTKGGALSVEEDTKKGLYFINISDYTSQEILFLSNYITDKLLKDIWNILIAKELKPFSISLSDKKLKEIILEENPKLFKTEDEFQVFCKQYGLSIKSFIEPANFSELEIKLKKIDARFEMEQFFARRYLFCSTLINKLQKRISEYVRNGNSIDEKRLEIVNSWIEKTNSNLDVIKDFKDFHKLYDMPKADNKIEIKNSNNINIIGGDLSKSKISQKKNANTKSESRFSKRIKIWTLILMALGLIITIIINWEKIF